MVILNYVKRVILAFLGSVCLLLALRIACGPLIWQNLTDSGPHGLYIYAPYQKLQRGDWCVVNLPQDVPGLHVAKGYKLIKQVCAFNGEHYDVNNNQLLVHQKSYTITRAEYLPQLQDGQYIVPTNHYLFLNTPSLSFDSRYLGPINADDVQCKVVFILDYDKLNQRLLQIRSWFI